MLADPRDDFSVCKEAEHMFVGFPEPYALATRISVRYDGGQKSEVVVAAVTFFLGRIDEPGQQRLGAHFDLHDGFRRGFTDDAFEARFQRFRDDLARPRS